MPIGVSPSISVLIPAFNEEELIGQVLDSIRESFRSADFASYEIIVCDNNSTDATAERASAGGATVVFEGHNQISRARNKAAASASGDWLIFLDADTLLPPGLLRETIASLASGKICGGGSLVHFDADAQLGLLGTGMLRFWNGVSRWANVAAGSYVFCHRQGWADVGGFDERIYAGEEILFSRNLRRWGAQRGMRFTVLTRHPVVTSARKMEWFGAWHLLWAMIRLAVPGALKKRERCAVWYRRPVSKRSSKSRL